MGHYKNRPRRSKARRKVRVLMKGSFTHAEKLAAAKLEQKLKSAAAVRVNVGDIVRLRDGSTATINSVLADSTLDVVIEDGEARRIVRAVPRHEVLHVLGYWRL